MEERTDAPAQGDLFFYERQTPAEYPHLTTGFQSNTAIQILERKSLYFFGKTDGHSLS